MNAVISKITVKVNDEPRAFAARTTLLDALLELGIAERRGLAVAIDDTVVPRSEWSNRRLSEGERVLVIQATQGG